MRNSINLPEPRIFEINHITSSKSGRLQYLDEFLKELISSTVTKGKIPGVILQEDNTKMDLSVKAWITSK
jgi:hypothetical protein